MGLLDGGISSIFHAALSGLYLDATLHAGTGEPVYDAGGNITGYSGGDTACKAQVDAATDAMRRAEGYAEGDARIIVLAQGLSGIDSDHEITVRGQKYRILSAELDAAASHYVCRARAV
jgi:hypothetical protein